MNKKNGGGWTPLMYASYIGHDTIVHLLLEAGVSVNVPTPEGQTPLMLASSCGNESIAYFLLQVSYEGTQARNLRGSPAALARDVNTAGHRVHNHSILSARWPGGHPPPSGRRSCNERSVFS